MSFSDQSQAYWDGEHIRYLAEGNKVPSVEDRVKAAFDAGLGYITSICKIYYPDLKSAPASPMMKFIETVDKTKINFPRTTL